jgi:hypothetical protein
VIQDPNRSSWVQNIRLSFVQYITCIHRICVKVPLIVVSDVIAVRRATADKSTHQTHPQVRWLVTFETALSMIACAVVIRCVAGCDTGAVIFAVIVTITLCRVFAIDPIVMSTIISAATATATTRSQFSIEPMPLGPIPSTATPRCPFCMYLTPSRPLPTTVRTGRQVF